MYRAYHAIRGLTGPDGRSTNAVYGFVTMLRKLIADHDPQCIAAAFDLSGPTFRSELRDDYKANRAPMPSDLAEQIPFVHQACEALGVQVLTFVGFEADDVIGTLAARAVAGGRPVVIVTGDKDFFQLVDDSDRRACLQPARRRRLVRRGRGQDEVRRRSRAGRRCACADGGLHRQHQGGPGHRREGRARSDRDPRLAGRASRQCASAHRQETRAPDDACRLGARKPSAAANSHRRAAARGRRLVLRLPWARSPEVFRAVLLARFPIARHGICSHCRHRRHRVRRRFNGRGIGRPHF